MTNVPLNDAGLLSDPQGRFLFIPGELSSIIAPNFFQTGYSINSSTGAVASSAAGDVVGLSPAFHPNGKFLYVAGPGILTNPSSFQGIVGVDLSTANFAPVPGSPFSVGQEMGFLSIDPAGHFLYATVFLNPGLPPTNPAFETYSVDPTTGTLTLISTDNSPGVQPSGKIIFHPSGKFAYALNIRSGSPALDLYSVNATTGVLTFISTQANASFSLLMHPSGNFLYGCMAGPVGQPCQPVGYRIDNNTGVLTAIPGFSLGAVDGTNLVIDKSGQFAYALGQGGSQIFVYSIDASTGLMTQMPALTTSVPVGLSSIAAGR
jgi:6-phosphogluconolactonase (cycloisomerase 2 family)